MVERGAVSQRKRSPSGLPASGPSVQAFSKADRAVRTGSRSTAQAEAAGQFARDDLGDQRERALAGAAELHHVGAEIVRLDQGGQRPAFAQRSHVPGYRDMVEHAGQGIARGWAHNVDGSPKAGKSSAPNVVTSASWPSSTRMTSSLNARN
jgi:hypothetical protein